MNSLKVVHFNKGLEQAHLGTTLGSSREHCSGADRADLGQVDTNCRPGKDSVRNIVADIAINCKLRTSKR